jgi:hypothetical protein
VTSWQLLGSVEPTALSDARLQLHHAAQLVVAAGISYLTARPDDSHTNLEWMPAQQALAGNVLTDAGFRFAVRVPDLALMALRGDDPEATFSLSGANNDGALAWMRDQLSGQALDATRLTTRKHYEIPRHRVADGEPYALDSAANAELARHYHDAWLVTSHVERFFSGASAPRCWPHHFDLATLITLADGSAGARRTIGVGLTPGDAWYGEPYWYVGPYPYPPADRLPPLEIGRWHTKGWTGAVLTASEVTSERDATRQQERVLGFVDDAVTKLGGE